MFQIILSAFVQFSFVYKVVYHILCLLYAQGIKVLDEKWLFEVHFP